MRAVLLAAAAAAAENGSAWRERLGLAGSACPAECPLRHRSIVNIKDFGKTRFGHSTPKSTAAQQLLGGFSGTTTRHRLLSNRLLDFSARYKSHKGPGGQGWAVTHAEMRRALLLIAATTADAYAWRARLGLGGSICPLQCPIASRNVIVVEDLGPPGFTTRQRAIAEAASLAAQLCARLVLPVTACDAFSGRTTDDCRLKWSELYELRSATGASVIVERKEVLDAANATRLESAFPQNQRRLSKARVAAAEATLHSAHGRHRRDRRRQRARRAQFARGTGARGRHRRGRGRIDRARRRAARAALGGGRRVEASSPLEVRKAETSPRHARGFAPRGTCRTGGPQRRGKGGRPGQPRQLLKPRGGDSLLALRLPSCKSKSTTSIGDTYHNH